MIVVAVLALLNKGFVACPDSVIESHLLESDLTRLYKSVLLTLLVLH